ncbi:cytochrome d ubiquinol oxidase subunit II [Cellulomonas dongxiuzhuiae]|uniref:Cytochrome d ubiquinol oxidase subunit II n=1 Tax=Cellulomonas dongxiuzhuiae TaxID=2819979 RepID=A0ABX8GI56_9CELL|nr:cytochrome d ubiquinol oxidase subunit II [Cellulomonas dongxiuzhuiae]MBO3086780.1 cytochrome d ubiquinol oxidase subunit II [Cellulomonas dongxiuzhuiae]MBO3093867.1 cytochrome d ubiquinol oxidase subunit II [Cellulomonas dongxiuzhuiae]QWC14959.1 cytochrome d ubiquinol oxidase subunit II [Cellulomonas dongxiuzhuiae]
MDLPVVWFLLIAVLWTGYLVLEGFDFGVGMLLAILPRGDKARREKERRLMINTVGPVWDGNEVWLLTAGGATFAAFPEWYATLFSGFYLPLFLILIALIVRVVAFEWRGKIDDPVWRAWADRALIFGSFVPALLWGVAFANLVRGVELDANHQYVGGFVGLLSPFALLGGLVTLSLFLTHGAIFLAMKVDGDMRERAGAFAARSSVATLLLAGGWAVWAQVAYSGKGWTWAAVLVAAAALVLVVAATRLRREGPAFAASAVAIVAAVVLIFGSMFPDVMPAFDPANSLTVDNASSTDYTLTVMTWVAAFLTPVVLLYQGWTYWVFRKRLTIEHIPEATGLTFDRVVSRS